MNSKEWSEQVERTDRYDELRDAINRHKFTLSKLTSGQCSVKVTYADKALNCDQTVFTFLDDTHDDAVASAIAGVEEEIKNLITEMEQL